MTELKRFCIAVGAILIVFLLPVMILPMKFTASGVCDYITMILICIAVAAVWSIPDEDFL